MKHESEVNQMQLSAPLYVVWEINRKCNARCIHCYTASGPDADEEGMLTAEELWNVADQLSQAQVIHVGLSGGEPLLRRECVELVERLSAGGVIVSLATNGKNVTPTLAHRLYRAGLDSVTVSIDSYRADLHDSIRNCKGLFAAAIHAIHVFQEAKVGVVVGMTAMQANFRELEEFVEFLLEQGISSLNITGFVPVGRGRREHDLSGLELRDFLTEAIQLQHRYQDEIAIMWHDCRFTLLDKQLVNQSFKGCGAGNTTARITFDGHVTPCSTLPISAGNLRHAKFYDIWAQSGVLHTMRDRRNVADGSNCGQCTHLAECGGCRSISFAYTGNPWADNPHCWLK